MKFLLIAGLLTCSWLLPAQTKIEKTIPVQSGQKLEMSFDYPELIKIHTWDKQEILITGSVSINRGENDDAFQLDVESKNGTVSVSSSLKDKDNIPHRTIIRRGDEEYYFKTGDYNDPAIQKFIDEHGKDYTYMSNGIIRDITLEIFVPKGMENTINAKYGLVEITDYNGPLVVNATYGGIDASIQQPIAGELVARTKFGEILTNLDVKFNSDGELENHHHWTQIHAKVGNGPRYDFESKFGKVYLRKAAK